MVEQEKCQKILEWSVGREAAVSVVKNNVLLSKEMLPPHTKLSPALLDYNVDITFLKPYCVNDAFWEIANLLKKCSVQDGNMGLAWNH